MLSLASRICQARRSTGLSQAKLAARVGVQRTAVGQWERSNGCRPNTEHMIQVASVCGVAFEWLATGRGPKWPNGTQEEVSALQLNYYAHDELEERLLLALRQIPYRERIPLVALVEAIAVRPSEAPRRLRDLSTDTAQGCASAASAGRAGAATAQGCASAASAGRAGAATAQGCASAASAGRAGAATAQGCASAASAGRAGAATTRK